MGEEKRRTRDGIELKPTSSGVLNKTNILVSRCLLFHLCLFLFYTLNLLMSVAGAEGLVPSE